MDPIIVNDELLYYVMPRIDNQIEADYPKTDKNEHFFSNKFEIKMDKLLRKERRLKYWYMVPLTMRKVILGSLIPIILALLISNTSIAIHLSFYNSVVTAFKRSMVYSFFVKEEVESGAFSPVEPSIVPDGYNELYRQEGELYLHIEFENATGEMIIWEQMLVTDSLRLVLDSEYDWDKTINYKGREVKMYGHFDGYVTTYYEFEDCLFIIDSDNLAVEDILDMLPY